MSRLPPPAPGRPVPARAGADDIPAPLPGAAVSVVVCARNEAATVVDVLARLRAALPSAELILVDNGSTDGTGTLAAARPDVRVVLEATPGKGTAMRTGARAATRAWLLLHDADAEYDPADAPAVVAAAQATGGCAVGARLVRYDEMLLSSWLANRLLRAVLRWRLGLRVPDVLSGTRCLPRDLFLSLGTTSRRFGIETELTRALARRHVPTTAVPVRFTPRSAAEGKKIRLRHLGELLYQALR